MTKQVEYTQKKEVACDGTNVGDASISNVAVTLGHPKIYLKIEDNKDSVVCPYCSKTFIYKQVTAN